MTERERWIVYPLLFLALGASLRDKLGGRTTIKSIVCQELRIEDEPVGNQPPRTLLFMGRTEAGPNRPPVGALVVNGEVAVSELVKVNGIVNAGQVNASQMNANQYVCQGFLFMPAFQPLPGISMQDLVRALQATQAQQRGATQQAAPPAKSPADAKESPAGGTASPPKSTGDAASPAKK
jgi:hypothetical protein